MSYVAARQILGGYMYFENNINDSPKWTTDKKKAMRFDTSEDALIKSDKTKVYTGSIIAIELEE